VRFKDANFSRIGRYAIGFDTETSKYYISILCRNHMIDYDEYYEITPEEFKIFSQDIDKARDLAQRCRERQEEHRLFYQPSIIRGSPI